MTVPANDARTAVRAGVRTAVRTAVRTKVATRLAGRMLACAAMLLASLPLAAGEPAPVVAPKLILVLVVDGLPQDQVLKYRDQLPPGGLRRLLDQGAWFANAHHGHAVTLTAPGHASVLTGTYPYRHGIIANEWTDRDSDAQTPTQVYCTSDSRYRYLGEETKALDGTAPTQLQVGTLGDELRIASGGKSRVVAISGKDRGAILLAGKRGTAYMYMDRSGRFASSDFYMPAHPAWHSAYYASKPQDRWLGQAWTPLLPETAYARSVSVQSVGQASHALDLAGMGKQFPFVLGGRSGSSGSSNSGSGNSGGSGNSAGLADARYYNQLMRTPFGDEATLDFARAAIVGEQLGANPAGVPDLLGISLSTHDYINHAFGPESTVSHDHLLQLDRALARFFDWLDQRIGREQMLMVLTADHGFMNAPEFSRSIGMPGERLNSRALMQGLNAALEKRFGMASLARGFSYPTILLDRQRIGERTLSQSEVEREAAAHLMRQPGIVAVFTRSQLEQGQLPATPLSLQVQRAWHAQRSGELYVVTAPGSMLGSNAATHGSPWQYDSHVPLLFHAPGRIRPGQYLQAAAVVDIAPTLAMLLGLRPPAASEGRVLQEMLLTPHERRNQERLKHDRRITK